MHEKCENQEGKQGHAAADQVHCLVGRGVGRERFDPLPDTVQSCFELRKSTQKGLYLHDRQEGHTDASCPSHQPKVARGLQRAAIWARWQAIHQESLASDALPKASRTAFA